MNNHVIPENTPLGTIVYTLKGVDPEGSPVKFGLMGTDRLKVDEKTGVVTVVKVIDREVRCFYFIFAKKKVQKRRNFLPNQEKWMNGLTKLT